MRHTAISLGTLALASALGAQPPTLPVARVSAGEGFDFSIRNIMRGPELYGRAPTNVRWSADGRWIYFQWNAPGTDWREPLRPYRIRAAAGAAPERLTIAQADSALPYIVEGTLSPDLRTRAVDANGDLYLVRLNDGSARRLTQTVANETRPTFSSDGRTLYFLRDNNAYSMSVASGEVRQLTDIRTGPAPTDSAKAAGQRGRLEQQQRDLFDVVRDRAAADSATRADRKAREAAGLQPIYIAATERVIALDVAPNGRAAIAIIGLPATTTRQSEVPQFVTSNGYVENLRIRTKVGDATGKQRVLWISLPSGRATPLKLFASDSAVGTCRAVGGGAVAHDVEQVALLLLEAATLAGRLRRVRGRGAGADVGELAYLAAGNGHGVRVVVAHEIQRPAVAGKRRAGFVPDGLRESPSRSIGEPHQVQVAIRVDGARPQVR